MDVMTVKNVSGVWINGQHSYRDFGMFLAARPDKGTPPAQTFTVSVSGADGVIDVTEMVTGDISYNNRPMKLTFSAFVEIDKQAEFQQRVSAWVHGKRVEIIFDEDPDWFYTGRASVSFSKITPLKMRISISVDAFPYKLSTSQDRVDFDLSSSAFETGESYWLRYKRANVEKWWNTDMRFGTKARPTGDFSIADSIKWFWDANSNKNIGGLNCSIAVYASNTDTPYTREYTTPFALAVLPVSALSTAGLDVSKIYRIVVYNVGDLQIYGTVNASVKKTIYNDRMPCNPTIYAVSAGGLKLLVNGRVFSLPHQDAPELQQISGLVFREGENEVIVKRVNDEETSGMALTMWFQRGML